MRALVQRVSSANVRIDKEVHGAIDRGFLVLLGVGPEDTKEDSDYLVRKITQLRVFADADGKMNQDLFQVGGSVLVVSQFTLYADTRRGNRPSFTKAAPPELGERLYREFVAGVRDAGLTVATGEFGADMQVSLVNDGPVTIWFDTEEKNAG